MYFTIKLSPLVRPEPDNTVWTASTSTTFRNSRMNCDSKNMRFICFIADKCNSGLDLLSGELMTPTITKVMKNLKSGR